LDPLTKQKRLQRLSERLYDKSGCLFQTGGPAALKALSLKLVRV